MGFEKLDVVLKVIAALDELGIPYLIGGSFASSLYGLSRSTNDADLLAAIKPEHTQALARKLEPEFYVEEAAIKRAVQTGRHFNISPEDTVLAKLEWYRRGNEVSDLQWRDILNVIKVQGDRLDREYMQHWAQELGVADLLEQAFVEAKKSG
jgi:hypothetical protein